MPRNISVVTVKKVIGPRKKALLEEAKKLATPLAEPGEDVRSPKDQADIKVLKKPPVKKSG